MAQPWKALFFFWQELRASLHTDLMNTGGITYFWGGLESKRGLRVQGLLPV